MLELKNVNLMLNEKPILKDINFLVENNKITALIGANGAGKTSIFNCIARFLLKYEGSILIDGEDIKTIKHKEYAKLISTLKQSSQINLRITIYELVCFGRFPHCGGRLKDIDKEKVLSAIEYVGLSEIKNKYLDELSGGERQRAYIAMIIAQDTKYILLDEPLNNLDMKYSVEFMILLNRLVKELNKTILIVLHDINMAASYCDYMIALKDGNIHYQGSPDEMLNKKILDEVFDHDFCIANVDGQKTCIYYNRSRK